MRVQRDSTAVARAAAVMSGMPLTPTAEAALRRVDTAQSTTEQEVTAARQRALVRAGYEKRGDGS